MLKLRRLNDFDLADRAAWFSNEKKRATMPLEGDYTLANTRSWYRKALEDPTRLDLTLEDDGKCVAMGGIVNMSEKLHGEIYVIVGSGMRGRGYGRKLVVGICEVGFRHLALNRLYLWTYATNARAMNLYESCGFQTEARLREHAVVDGARVDRIGMGLLAREWHQAESAPDDLEIEFALGEAEQL